MNYLLDLDGTVYRGASPIPYAREFIQYLMKNNRSFLFVTNCPGHSPEQLVDKLRRMDIHVGKENILTSAQAAADYLSSISPLPSVYLIGSDAFREELLKAGIQIVEQHPEYVVVGYDTDFTYEKMKKACWWVMEGARYICTNMDFTIPEGERMVPHTGPIALSIQAATGTAPLVIGKPNKIILEAALQRLKCRKEDCCIVGDRLDTDIQTGINNGVRSFLVFTGVTDAEELKHSPIQPDKAFKDLRELMLWDEQAHGR